jgi:hypothetical protein
MEIHDGTTHGGLSVALTVAVRTLSADDVKNIAQADREILDRSLRVMSRIHFANHLRFGLPLSPITTDLEDAVYGYDRNDLEVYLLCTCLDTLAGHDNYLDFGGWARTSKLAYPGIREREDFLATLYDSPKALDHEVYNSILEKLLELYQKNYGITRNIRNLIGNLPLFIRQEIVNSYTIHKVTNPVETWNLKTTEQKLKTILDYLLECRRHQYTHSANTVPTLGDIRDMRKSLMDNNIDLPSPETKQIKWDGAEYNITCHYGDEACLLREIISACLAHEFGVLDEDWIIRYRQAERQRRFLYALIYETEYNLKVIQLHLGSLFEGLVILGNNVSPHFRIKVAEAILQEENMLLRLFIPMLDKYVESAVELNKVLDEGKALDKEFLNKSQFRSVAPILRGFYDNLLYDYPLWVYDRTYVPDFSL